MRILEHESHLAIVGRLPCQLFVNAGREHQQQQHAPVDAQKTGRSHFE